MTQNKPLCIITMVKEDYDILRVWLRHYMAQVDDPKSIYIISHGADPLIEEIASACSVITIPFDNSGERFEEKRRKFLLMFASGLQSYFDNVIVVDSDELVAVNPKLEVSLASYLSSVPTTIKAISPVGFEVRQKLSSENQPLDMSKPIFSQRSHGFIVAKYCKPCIIRSRITSGTAHQLFGIPWHIDTNLVLFHLKYIDESFSHINMETRKAILELYDSHNSHHGIKGWSNSDKGFLEAAESVENDCEDFDLKNLYWLAPRLRLALKRRGVVPNFSFGPYRLPEQFRNLI